MNKIDNVETLKDTYLNLSSAAHLLGHSQNYVSELVKERGMPKSGHNQFPLVDCVKWQLNYQIGLKQQEIDKLRAEIDPAKENQKNSAILKQLQIDREMNNLLSREDVEKLYFKQIEIIIKMVDSLAAKLSVQLVGRSDVRDIQRVIEDEIFLLKENIANELFGNALKEDSEEEYS
jgi:hypothetical protein